MMVRAKSEGMSHNPHRFNAPFSSYTIESNSYKVHQCCMGKKERSKIFENHSTALPALLSLSKWRIMASKSWLKFFFLFSPPSLKKSSLSWVEGKIYCDKQSHLYGKKTSWSVIKNERVFCKFKNKKIWKLWKAARKRDKKDMSKREIEAVAPLA